MKVLMADDDTAMRDRLVGLMAGVATAQLRFVEQNAVVAMLNAAAWRPDVVILDVFMRGAATLRLMEEMKKEWPGMAVVISAWMDQPYSHVYLTCGADGFLDKSGGWEALGTLLLERASAAAAGQADERRLAIAIG